MLVRGEAGSGKTGLCLGLMGAVRQRGLFGCLVGDDSIELVAMAGGLVARSVSSIAGLVERRGLGLTPMAFEPAARVRLVVDCVTHEPTRLPEPDELVTRVSGVTLPRLAVWRDHVDPGHVIDALALFNDEPWLR